MNKSTFYQFVVLGIVISMPLKAAALTDIDNSRNKEAILALSERGIISGYPDGTFKPQNTVNRAELIKILVESNGVHPSLDQFQDCFPDVQKEWFAPFVCYAKEQGWISGYPDGSFRPQNIVKKVEAIKIIVNSQSYSVPDSVSSTPFSDIDKSAWYAPFVKTAYDKGILEQSNGILGIDDNMTRGTASESIYRAVLIRENVTQSGAIIDHFDPTYQQYKDTVETYLSEHDRLLIISKTYDIGTRSAMLKELDNNLLFLTQYASAIGARMKRNLNPQEKQTIQNIDNQIKESFAAIYKIQSNGLQSSNLSSENSNDNTPDPSAEVFKGFLTNFNTDFVKLEGYAKTYDSATEQKLLNILQDFNNKIGDFGPYEISAQVRHLTQAENDQVKLIITDIIALVAEFGAVQKTGTIYIDNPTQASTPQPTAQTGMSCSDLTQYLSRVLASKGENSDTGGLNWEDQQLMNAGCITQEQHCQNGRTIGAHLGITNAFSDCK